MPSPEELKKMADEILRGHERDDDYWILTPEDEQRIRSREIPFPPEEMERLKELIGRQRKG